MRLAIYSETTDSVRDSEQELALAEGLLKVSMCGPEGAILSNSDSFDSPLLLSPQVAGNRSFLSLVEMGRLRFTRWPDGKGPSEGIEAVLKLSKDDYILSAWPELQDRPELRPLALDVFADKRKTTGLESVDSRIDRARDLFAAVKTSEEKSPRLPKETKRADLFAEALASAGIWLPRPETTPDVALAVKDLAEFEGRHWRSKVYGWIDNRDMSEDDKARMKDLIDGRYNRTVADSMKLLLSSSRRFWKTMPNTYHEGTAESQTIELFDDLDTDAVQPIEWKTLSSALAPYGPTPYSKDQATEAFETVLDSISKHQQSFTIGGAIAGASVSTIIAISLRGAALDWATAAVMTAAAYIGYGSGKDLGRRIGAKLDKRWRGNRLADYAGFQDALAAIGDE